MGIDSYRLSTRGEVVRLVEEAMRPENIKVEVFEKGKWVNA